MNEKSNKNCPGIRGGRRRLNTLIIMALVILVPAGAGFLNKFWEFYHTLRTDSEGAFTIVPMMTYLTVAAGFLCLLVWATMNGMFRDIEQPKYEMLENELRLDGETDLLGR